MRNILITICLTLIISVSTVFIFQAFKTQKIGYIKSAVVLQDYKAMIDVNTQFNNELKLVQSNLDTLKARFENLRAQEAMISEKEKSNWSYKIGIAQNEYEKYNQQASEQMQARRNELTKKVLEQINNLIQKYGKENNYKLILGTTEDGSILYGLESDDLTEKILTQLNEAYTEMNKDQSSK